MADREWPDLSPDEQNRSRDGLMRNFAYVYCQAHHLTPVEFARAIAAADGGPGAAFMRQVADELFRIAAAQSRSN